jgi:predicted ATP-binding protein involved in virulence
MSNQRTEKKRADKKQGGIRRTEKKRAGEKRAGEKRAGKRRTQKRRTEEKRAGKKHHCENNTTLHSLQKWYDNAFKNLGWMVLAKQRGNMEDKILVYKNTLRRLMHKIECKLHSVSDHDNKEDLKIMLENVKVLCEHADKDL